MTCFIPILLASCGNKPAGEPSVEPYRNEECYLKIRANYKGDLTTIEFPIIFAVDGTPPISEFKFEYFNGESFTIWGDERKAYKMEGKRDGYYRVTFSLPPFDSELIIIDGATL